MYQHRNRNLDIAIATIIAILGGLAAAKHLPGQVRIPLGIGLFFAPGYLWSEAILSMRLPGVERFMTSVGMALILPILGGFLFYGLHIPLFESSWIALLVVLTLLGVVAVAIQRLREVPPDERQQLQREQQRRGQQPRDSGSVVLHSLIFGLAALIGIGSIVFSVKSAQAEKFPGYTSLSLTQVIQNDPTQAADLLSPNQTVQAAAQEAENKAQAAATQAHLYVANYQGVPEEYELKLLEKGKVIDTWPITLNDGQSWQKTIAWTTSYSILADLYLLPNTTTPFHYVDNGTCVSNLKDLPTVLQTEDPCDVKS